MPKINLNATTNNERGTERLVREWLDVENNIKEPGEGLSKYTEQYNLGGKRPDFLTFYSDEKGRVCIIVEAKDKSRIHGQGEEQVKGYMQQVSSQYATLDVIGIAASTTPKGNLKLTSFHQLGGNVVDLKAKQDISYLINQIRKEEEGISKKRSKIAGWREVLSKELAQLHEHVRNYCSASGDAKMNLIFGSFLALLSEDFRKNLLNYPDNSYSKVIFNAIVSTMMSKTYDPDQMRSIKDGFAFLDIETLPINKLTVPSNLLLIPEITESKISFSKFIVCYIEKFIWGPLRSQNECSAADVASAVYNEFLKYNKSDAQDLGIVLTPEHVSDLMVKLLDLKPEDTLLDICTGSGAFLVAGMKEKIVNSNTGSEEIKSTTGLIGVELMSHMFASAICNVLFNNGEISNLMMGSCYEEKIVNKIKSLKPTKAILNPPYAMYKNDSCEKNLNELGFINHALSFLPVGGKCVAIIPTSCLIKDGVFSEYRDIILENNRLDAVIECNPKLFTPAANVATSIVVITSGIPHDKSSTIYANGIKDGYKSGKRGSKLDSNVWDILENQIIKDVKSDEISEISRHFKTKLGKGWDHTEEHRLIVTVKEFEDCKKYYYRKEESSSSEVDTSSWKPYKITDLFEIKGGSSKTKDEGGKFPLITAKTTNNGKNGGIDTFNNENCFTISSHGAPGKCFWHPYKFHAGNNVIVATPKKTTPLNVSLFLTTVISNSLLPKYSYGKVCSQTRLSQESILLPTKNNEPDWDFMEEFMDKLKTN